MKKVLMVLMGLEIGGAETHVVGLSLTLQQRGWEVVVASNGGVYEKKLEEHGFRHYQIRSVPPVQYANRSVSSIHIFQPS